MASAFQRFTLTLQSEYTPDMNFWSYFCYQEEIAPTTGNHHWQAYGETHKKHRDTAIGTHFKNHNVKCNVLVSKGDATQNIIYCSKNDTSVTHTFKEFGTVKPKHAGQGQRTDLHAYSDAIVAGATNLELIQNHPHCVMKFPKYIDFVRTATLQARSGQRESLKVIYIYGPSGTGKSHYSHTVYPEADTILANKWFDGYSACDVLRIEDLCPQQFDRNFLLTLLDRYSLKIQIKGGYSYAVWTKVIITSNYHPSDILCDEAFFRRITGLYYMDTKYISPPTPSPAQQVAVPLGNQGEQLPVVDA